MVGGIGALITPTGSVASGFVATGHVATEAEDDRELSVDDDAVAMPTVTALPQADVLKE